MSLMVKTGVSGVIIMFINKSLMKTRKLLSLLILATIVTLLGLVIYIKLFNNRDMLSLKINNYTLQYDNSLISNIEELSYTRNVINFSYIDSKEMGIIVSLNQEILNSQEGILDIDGELELECIGKVYYRLTNENSTAEFYEYISDAELTKYNQRGQEPFILPPLKYKGQGNYFLKTIKFAGYNDTTLTFTGVSSESDIKQVSNDFCTIYNSIVKVD